MKYRSEYDYGIYKARPDDCLWAVYYHDDTVGFKETLLYGLFRWQEQAAEYVKAQKKRPNDEYYIRRVALEFISESD